MSAPTAPAPGRDRSPHSPARGTFLEDVGTVFRREVLEFRRKRALIVTLFVGPLVLMLLFGLVFPNMQAPADVPFGIVVADEPSTGESEAPAFVARLEAVNAQMNAFVLTPFPTEDAARRAVESERVRGFFVIPEDFTDVRRHGGYAAPVHVYYDQSNPTLGRLVAAQAELLVNRVAAEEGADNVQGATHLGSREAVQALMRPYETSAQAVTGAAATYFQFLVPGMIMLATMTNILLGVPNAVSRDKDAGALDAVLAAPVSRAGFFVGKLAGAATRGLAQVLIVMVMGVVIFGVSFEGHLGLIALLVGLSMLSFSGFALAMATLMTPESDPTKGIRAGITFPLLFMSGVLFPVESLPAFLRPVSAALPLTYAVTAMRKVVIVGAELESVLPEVLVLVGFTVVGFLLSVPLMRRYGAAS